ncbi:MAG: type II toxin-antitoxin system Phd/YefM family antitoxin [Candidatus Baltobacteraceae bacterium]|jgi:prevent-host-death family protein
MPGIARIQPCPRFARTKSPARGALVRPRIVWRSARCAFRQQSASRGGIVRDRRCGQRAVTAQSAASSGGPAAANDSARGLSDVGAAAIDFQLKWLYSGQTGRKVGSMATWQVQDAKTRFSELIERARTEGPQTITRHGRERAVLLSIEDYRALAAHKPDFKAYLLGGPKVEDFPLDRDRDTGRAVEL